MHRSLMFRYEHRTTHRRSHDPAACRTSRTRTGLWESIDTGLPDTDERAAIKEALRRDEELSSGKVTGRTHEEVMQAARRALECG